MRIAFLFLAILSLSIWPVNYFKHHHQLYVVPVQTIFTDDYQARQQVLRNINLYPNIPLARFFQNKVVIVTNKYFNNLFSLIDPNYYFFGSHPREIVGQSSFVRLPLSLLPIIFWFFLFCHHQHKRFISYAFLTTISSLSFLSNTSTLELLIYPVIIYLVYVSLLELFRNHPRIIYYYSLILLLETVLEFSKP